MELGIITELITGLGFPIALAVAFLYMFWKMMNAQREDAIKREEHIRQSANEREEQVRQAAKEREAYAREREERDREQIKHFSEIISVNSKALLENAQVMEKINTNILNISEDVHKLQDDVTLIKVRQENKDK